MSGARPAGPVDEFEAIARLLRPLAEGAPGALGLMDDAAVVASRPGFDLVVSKDAMVEGVHFLPDDGLDLVARKLLRVNLSDLAAKGAEPFGYLMATAWSPRCGWPERELFARGLAEDQGRFGVSLLGGDTVSTPGPLTLSLTILGWVPDGRMVRRSGAKPGDRVLISGGIGDGWLGLKAASGELAGLPEGSIEQLAGRYRLPEPRLELAEALRTHASASADVSDGLVADAGHIAEASGVGLRLELGRVPLSAPAAAWLAQQPEPARAAAMSALAAGGDDYEVVCTASPDQAGPLIAAAKAAGVEMTDIGEVVAGQGAATLWQGREVRLQRTGWRHG
jgi:thiamine-monophosphate kinase